MVSALENFAKTSGEALGVPTPYLIQLEKAIRKGQPENIIFSEYAVGDPPPFEVAQKMYPTLLSKMGAQDSDAMKEAMDEAIKNKASTDKIAELKAKDWTYDAADLIKDTYYLSQKLNDKQRSELSPLASYVWNYKEEKQSFDTDLSSLEKLDYADSHPDFVAGQFLAGEWSDWTEYGNLEIATKVSELATKYNIPLNLIRGFKPDTDGTERFPSDKTLWKSYFDYYDLPGSSYLNMAESQVDAGELPDKYLKEWTEYHKLTTDKAKEAYRKAHKEASKATWRDDYRKANPTFDKWLQEEGGMKALAKKKASTSGGSYQASRSTGSTSTASFGSAPSISRTSTKKISFPKAKMGMSIRAPKAPGI